MKKIIVFISGIVMMQFCWSQSSILDSAKNEIYLLNKVFDSSRYIYFDLDIHYKSDSFGVTKETDQLSGNYVINQKNIYSQMGSNIYLQTDSFAYSIYPDEKMMIMTKNFIAGNSEVFPLKNFIDTMLHYYDTAYDISIDNYMIDSFTAVRHIKFDRTNVPTSPDTSETKYNYFSIEYDSASHYPTRFEFSYFEQAVSEVVDSLGNTVSSTPYQAVRTVIMQFTNYKGFWDTDIFDDSRYVYYNRQRKIFQPAEKYRDYQFNTSGFENEDEEAKYYREVPAEPGGNN